MTTLPHRILMLDRPDPQNALRVDMACLPMLTAMMRNGIRIDRTHLTNLHNKITEEMRELGSEVEHMTGFSGNLSSGDQLAELIYGKLELKQAGKEKWTKSKARLAADSDVLKAMISRHPCIPVILKFKEREKIRAAFTLSLIAQADSSDRIHCRFKHTSTETGRLSSDAPNLQQIPGRTALGKEVRRGFVAPKGEVLGVVDLAQIESRTMAKDANCSNMLSIFEHHLDLYWTTSEHMYKRKFTDDEKKHGIEEVTGLPFKAYYRQSAKTVALGTVYSISPSGLVDLFLSSDPPAIPFLTGGESAVWDYDKYYETAVTRCAKSIQDFFDSYPELLTRRREHHRRARRYGYVWDGFGRIRWIPQTRSCHPWIVEEGLRAAGNMNGQGTAAGILKVWLAVSYDRIQAVWGKWGVKPLLTCHDEICVSGPRSAVDGFLDENKEIIRGLIPRDLFNCPIDAESSMAETYGDAK